MCVMSVIAFIIPIYDLRRFCRITANSSTSVLIVIIYFSSISFILSDSKYSLSITLRSYKENESLFSLFLLQILAVYMVLSKECTNTHDCWKGHACIKTSGTMRCEAFAHKGKRCSHANPEEGSGQIYDSYPPCHPDHHLVCKSKYGREICVKE